MKILGDCMENWHKELLLVIVMGLVEEKHLSSCFELLAELVIFFIEHFLFERIKIFM